MNPPIHTATYLLKENIHNILKHLQIAEETFKKEYLSALKNKDDYTQLSSKNTIQEHILKAWSNVTKNICASEKKILLQIFKDKKIIIDIYAVKILIQQCVHLPTCYSSSKNIEQKTYIKKFLIQIESIVCTYIKNIKKISLYVLALHKISDAKKEPFAYLKNSAQQPFLFTPEITNGVIFIISA